MGARLSENADDVTFARAALRFSGESMFLDKDEFRPVQEGEDLTDTSVLVKKP